MTNRKSEAEKEAKAKEDRIPGVSPQLNMSEADRIKEERERMNDAETEPDDDGDDHPYAQRPGHSSPIRKPPNPTFLGCNAYGK